MATGVNVKMGVTGVSQFKKDMKEAQASVKTLDAALKLNEEQFKATGDSEAYLQEKTDLLTRKMEQQEKVVDAAKAALNKMEKDGVNKASDAYQKMQQQVLKAETDLVSTQNAMNGVGDAALNAATDADKMSEHLKDINKGVSFQNVTDGIGKITDTMQKAFTKAIQLGKAITKEVLGAGTWADDLATKAAYYQLSEEDLQRMEKTANLIDTSVEAIVGAQKKLRKGLGNGDKGVQEALAGLFGKGYESKNWEDTFWKAGEALMKFTDEEKQEAYAQKLFGKSWSELIPLFQAGREEYENLNKSWSVVSQENLDNLKEMDDQYQKLSGEFETFKMTLLSTFAEPLTKGMEAVTAMFEQLNKYLESPEGQAAMKALGDTVTQLITDLTQVNPEDVINGLKGVVDGITEAFKWIQEHHEDVSNALIGIGVGFASLKLATVGLNIAKVVSGFKGLLGGGGGTGTETAGGPSAVDLGTGALLGTTGVKIGAIASKIAAVDPTGVSALIPSWFMDTTGFGQELRGTKEKGSTVEEIKQNASDWWNDYKDVLTNARDYWNGIGEQQRQAEEWNRGDDATVEELMAFVQEQEKMNQVVEESNKVQDDLSKNMVKPDDLKKLQGLPNAVADAVSKVGFVVELDGENVVAVINRRLGIKLAGE